MRGSGFSGPLSLSPSDILAWSQLTGVNISPWEFRSLIAMDVEYMDGVRRHQDEQRAKYKTQAELGGDKKDVPK